MPHSNYPELPEFLKISPEARRAAWADRKLTVISDGAKLSSDQIFRRDMDALYARAQEERDAQS